MVEPGSVESEAAFIAPEHSKGAVAEKDGHSPFPVVGIGASAGGLEAFSGLLAALPVDTGMAFLIVQHLDPTHESKLAELLARTTSMAVVQASSGLRVEPNRVYVIPPATDMALAHGAIVLKPREPSAIPHLPVDYLFRSLAEEQQGRAIGVVLSGTGSDGTLGLCEIKAVGGITFAQDEASAGHAGMPTSAAESGCVDFVQPVAEIARSLGEIAAHPYLHPQKLAEKLEEGQAEGAFKRVLRTIRSAKGVDFSLYRDTTIRRRVLRRMALHRTDGIVTYARRVESDPDEANALYHDLLINVTSFFRDAAVFEVLKQRVYPAMMKNRPPSTPIRVWVPGCSTGQEAYSIAMTLVEFLDDKPVRPPIQIFATDLTDQTTLDKARSGVYPETIEAEVTAERLRRFFRKEDHVYRIDKALRDLCVFARQNVAADPPFSHVDVISCRNVLIYLSSPLQKRVLPMFHYALNPTGFLVLGPAESLGESADLFDPFDRDAKVYAKKATPSRAAFPFAVESFRAPTRDDRRTVPESPRAVTEIQREADRILLGRFAPASVLLNENHDVLQYRGRTGAYLEAPSGEPTSNVLKLAREGLLLPLRSALDEAKKTRRPSVRERVRVSGNPSPEEITLEVVPLRLPASDGACMLVLFHEPAAVVGNGRGEEVRMDRPREPAAFAPGEPEDAEQLRQELIATREYLHALVEQQDAANEELRSANEEILSANEELQSTNEELETAKEELQSANEELVTVNEELNQRNMEVNQVNSDLINLQSSTTIPVIMVGPDLCVRRYTTPAQRVLGLQAGDVGRPLVDLRLHVPVPDLERMMHEVVESMQPRECEVQDREGRWFGVRVHPYRTVDNRIDGAVVVFIDIDEAKSLEVLLRETDRRKDVFLATLAHELRNPIAPIRNTVEILRHSQGNAEATGTALEILARQVAQLSRIVDDLIDVGRVIEGKVDLRRQRVALDSVVQLAVETSRSLIEASGHRLRVILPPTPLYLDADPARISQVLVNLLNNSAKYMKPGGEIRIEAERVPMRRRSDPAIDEVKIVVRDEGMGITKELMPHIFEMFAQGQRRFAHGSGGLGVGLALVQSLVGLHAGRVEATSAGPDQGSQFTIWLPLAREADDQGEAVPAQTTVAEAEPDSVVAKPRRRLRILVVDDNQDQVRSMAMLLELEGHEVFVAYDGPNAMDAIIEHRPDLALVDLGLPGMSGYEVARRIRQRPELRGILLVAQTGWGQEEDRRRSAEAGFDHHVVKPMDLRTLHEIVERVTPGGRLDGPDRSDPASR